MLHCAITDGGARLTWKSSENTTVRDYFNFTTTKTQQGSYNLSGITHDNLPLEDYYSTVGNVTMPACNSSEYTDDWQLDISTSDWWNNEGWANFTFPSLDVQFDNNTANLTLNGYFTAENYVSSNSVYWMRGPTLGTTVQGSVQIRFSGLIDTYHSDVMNLTGENPVWLRTVGFGNNSLNIGNTRSAGSRPYPALAVAVTAFMGYVASIYM